MAEPRGLELINRYKKNFNIRTDANITEEMILTHWELEKRLTRELLQSNPENRWEVFEKCYTMLYGELNWLNQFIDTDNSLCPDQRYKSLVDLIGMPDNKKIYEVGSGKGELIKYLTNCGFDCKATEITRHRGQKYVLEYPNISWGISDGVHLERFERLDYYDIVISDQVIEHIHPDDIYDHFRGVLSILSVGGRYIFATPHRYMGPSDISKVFKCDMTNGMHLKEYTYRELKEILEISGFNDISAVLMVPIKITQLSGLYFKPKASSAYFMYLCCVEKMISLLHHQSLRRKIAKTLLPFLFLPNIFIVSHKERKGDIVHKNAISSN